MMIKHVQTERKVKKLIQNDGQLVLALEKMEFICKRQYRAQTSRQLNKLIDSVTFPIQESQNMKMYLQILQEENVSYL